MELNQQALIEFKNIWLEDHPEQAISDDQVLKLATKVMDAFRTVYIPIPSEKLHIYRKIKLDTVSKQRYNADVAHNSTL